MTREEAIAIIRKEYLCVDRDCDIERSCGRCDLMIPNKEPILQAYKMAIQALEYDDARYHEEHGEVIVAKEVWADARKALQALDNIKSEIRFITDTNGVKHIHRDDVFKIIDRYIIGEEISDRNLKMWKDIFEEEKRREGVSE